MDEFRDSDFYEQKETSNFRRFMGRNKWRVTLCALAVVFVILVLTINFWRTLLIFSVVGIAYFFGLLLDQGGRERVKQFFDGLFADGNR